MHTFSCALERSSMGYFFSLPQHDSDLKARKDRDMPLGPAFNDAAFLRLERQIASDIWKAVLPTSSSMQRLERALRSDHYIFSLLLSLSLSHTFSEFDLVPIHYFASVHTFVHAAPASIRLLCILNNSKTAYHYHALYQIQSFPGFYSVSS